MKRIHIVISILLASIALSGCDTGLFQKDVEVFFQVSSDFTFGNETTGWHAPTNIYISGNFNEWDETDSAEYELVDSGQGYFSWSMMAEPGTEIVFKYRIATEDYPEPRWWTDMRQCYDGSPGIAPQSNLIRFEDDGFEGYNAVYTVPEE